MASVFRPLRVAAAVSHRVPRRGFRTASVYNAAQNFTMPAMSPTMTEGNIASWKIKEGQPYSAGDVLLEIETDKAQMDVEAQDDGILFKITQQDGSKAVKVGSRIAVIADPNDDLASLEVPKEEESTQAQPTKQETSKAADQSPPERKPAREEKVPAQTSERSSTSASSRQPPQKYPLYPSVQFLLKERGLSKEDADKIPASGPNGRLLKGDVLSYLGKIEKDYSSKQSSRLSKLGHLDLSNVQIAAPKPAENAAPETAATPPPPSDTEVAVPISLSAVIATQKRVQDTLGINIPLSVFIGRASELANEDLPLSRRTPSADDLFNSVLGLDQVATQSSRGAYFPLITNMPASTRRAAVRKQTDIFDELLGSKRKSTMVASPSPAIPAQGIATPLNVFSVTARNGEEERVQAYLERMKLVLEGEPGRLVL